MANELAPGMMTDLQGNVVPIPQGAQQEAISQPAQSSDDNMMTDLQGNRVPIPQGAKQEPLPEAGAVSRFGSGVAAGIKAMLPSDLKSTATSVAANLATGGLYSAVEGAKGIYEGYQKAREEELPGGTERLYRMTGAKQGQPVISSVASGLGGVLGLDPEGIRERAAKGDIAGIVGEAIPSIALTLVGGEHERIGNAAKDTFLSDARQLKTSGAAHESAKATFNQRFAEQKIATDQAVKATMDAHDAADAFDRGEVNQQHVDDANTRASAAAANARKATQALKDAHSAVAEAGAEVDRVARKVQRSASKVNEKQTKAATQAREDFKKAIPPAPKGPAAYTDRDLDIADGYLEKHHQNVQQIGSVQDVYDALDHINNDMESQVAPAREKYAKEPITRNIKMDVRDALAENPKQSFVEKGMKALEDYNLTDPTIEEADKIRKQLNSEVRGRLTDTGWGLYTALDVDPEFAAKYHALDSLRDGEYSVFEDKGVNGIRELQRDRASIIKLRNAAEKQLKKGEVRLRGSNESSPLVKMIGKNAGSVAAGAGAGMGAMTGIPGGAEVGAMGGELLGKKLGKVIAPDDLTRNQLIKRRMKFQGAGVPTTDITGRPSPAGEFPPPSAVSPVMQLFTPQRELTPLHSDLATHYGESLNDTSYLDLEKRFKEDVASKRQHGVPLEPAEKTLLGKMNAQDAVDAARARQQMQEQAAKGKAQAGPTYPEEIEPLMQVPSSKLAEGMDTQRGIAHDIAHAVVGDARGIKFVDGIRSHLHPENVESGSLMSAPTDWTDFVDEEGNVDPQKMSKRMADVAAMYVAGGVANDLYHDIPYTENHHLGADVKILKSYFKAAGFSESEASKMIAQAADDAVQILSRPGVQDIIEKHAAVREGGLDEKYHISPERLDQIIQDVKGATNEGTTGKPARATSAGERPSEEVGAAAKATTEEGHPAVLRQEGKGPLEGEGGAVRGTKPGGKPGEGPEPTEPGAAPVKPEEAKLDEEDKLIMSERQSALKQPYSVEVTDQSGESHIEKIEGFSNKDVLKAAQKKFPQATEVAIRGSESKPLIDEYTIPNKKHLSMPASGDRTEVQTFRHELGHAMSGQNEGMTLKGMLRHTHPDLGGYSRAAVFWDASELYQPGTNRIRLDKLPAVIRSFMGGIAADEAFNDMPRNANRNFQIGGRGADGTQSYNILRNLGYSHSDALDYMHRAVDHDKEYLTHPAVSDIIKENEGTREPGLSRQYHYSPERLRQMHIEAQRRINAARQSNYGTIGREGAPGREGNVPGGEGGGPQAPRSGVQAAEAVKPEPPKLGMPPERTTGDENLDKRIKEAGGVPGGLQKGFEYDDPKTGEPKIWPDTALVHHESGSTLNVPVDMSVEDIRKALAGKTAEYNAGQVSAHERQGGSTFTPQGENLAGKDLYAVGSYPERTLQVDKLTPEVLAKFKSDNQDVLSQPGHAVGTWKDPDTGKSVLDVIRTHANRDEGVAAGQRANQKAIYHLGGEGEIPTGGTGEVKMSPAQDMINEAKDISGPTKFQLAEHNGKVELKSIETPKGERGKGSASQVMSQLTKLADKHGVQLELNANPFETGEGRLNYEELKKFYKKHGFEEKFAPGTEESAKETDYDPEYGYMTRSPRGGTKPSPHEQLTAIAETRAKFHDKVIAARNQAEPEHPGISALKS